jgi:two-component system, chemotaxis family, protein-glutamate methylesterase/glutaminase
MNEASALPGSAVLEGEPANDQGVEPLAGALGHDVVVVGASAGGVQALVELAQRLPGDLPAALLVVLHLGPGKSALPEILSRAGPLPACHPADGEQLRPGRIYAAPPDQHMVLRDGRIKLLRGPRENGHRPAIDVLFRSAARTYGSRVVGLVLTGNLDDGTAGLLAVKRQGGIAMVQDPAEASYPSMPKSAMESVEVDHVLPVAGLAARLAQLARTPAPTNGGQIGREPEMEEWLGQPGAEIGVPSGFTCPDCHGALWERPEGELVRYRCRTGHAFSPDSLAQAQEEGLEAALWAALRALEERISLARRIAKRMRDSGLEGGAERYDAQAEAALAHVGLLRGMLTSPGPGESG